MTGNRGYQMLFEDWMTSEEMANHLADKEGEVMVCLVFSKDGEEQRLNFTELQWGRFVRALRKLDGWFNDEDSV